MAHDGSIYQAKKRDGGTTGFFGKIVPTENGSLITGKFRKGISTYIFGIIWAVLTLFSGLICLSLKQEYGAAACAALFAVGIFFLFWDNKIKYLYSYLEGFPRYEEKDQKDE